MGCGGNCEKSSNGALEGCCGRFFDCYDSEGSDVMIVFP